MTNLTKAQLKKLNKSELLAIAEAAQSTPSFVAPVVEAAGNIYVGMTYVHNPDTDINFGALRVDNTPYISKQLAGWLKLRSDELKAGTTTMEAVEAEFRNKVRFDLTRAIKDTDNSPSFAEHAVDRKAKANGGFTRASSVPS